MKHNIRTITGAAFLGLTLITTNITFAQLVVKETTTTTSAGTISEFGADTIIVRSETSPTPIRYSYGKTTTYVDESGKAVSMEIVKSGLPVTVYYTKDGDRMVATKVIVRTATVPNVPDVETKKVTTTTTTTTNAGTIVLATCVHRFVILADEHLGTMPSAERRVPAGSAVTIQ